MSLLLTVIDPDTFEIALATEDSIESTGQLLLHPGEWHEGVSFDVWARFAGRRITLNDLVSAASSEGTDSSGRSAVGPGSDIPADVRDFTRCPGCGIDMIAGTLEIPSASLASRLLSGATYEDTQALRMTVGERKHNLMWTGQQLPARVCPDCGLVLFRF